jgi:hypothetical protein
VHRWDAEGTVGTPNPLDTAIAAAGLDELVDCFIPLQYGYGAVPPAVTVGLHADDLARTWTLQPPAEVAGGGPVGATAATLSGPASDLLLALLHRIPTDRLHVDGNPAATHHWLAFVPAF